jgi:cytochrome c oxidase subunit 3
MAENYQLVESVPEGPLSMHPKKFALWLFMVTVVMIFAAFTSAHIVRQAQGAWLVYELPSQFLINTGIIVLSSVFLHIAFNAAKKDNLRILKPAIVIATILAFGFLAGQWAAWGDLVADGNHFVGGNVAPSFLYVITGVHAAHLIGGVIYLLYILISSFR